MDCSDYALYFARLACVLSSRSLSESAIFKDKLAKKAPFSYTDHAALPDNWVSRDLPAILGNSRILPKEAAISRRDAYT